MKYTDRKWILVFLVLFLVVCFFDLFSTMNNDHSPREEPPVFDPAVVPISVSISENAITQSDFDWQFYSALNKELKLDTREKAYRHYVTHGMNMGNVPASFNWISYLKGHQDLLNANLTTKAQAYRHYMVHGKGEGRTVSSLQSHELWLKHRTPLPVVLDSSEPVRLNILMCGVGYDFTGGPLSIFHFAVLAAQQGSNVRWINIDNAGVSKEEMMTHMKKYDGLADFDKLIPYIRDGQNAKEIRTNPNDIFMATIYFTALMASATQKMLNNPNIIYFIQDFEPIFFPKNADYVEAIESYEVPHFAIYSTTFLRDYFQERRIGTYQGGDALGDFRSYAAMPAIKPFGEVKLKPHVPGKKRRLVMYARPHAPRNAFELSVSALSEAVHKNILNPEEWEFIGLGATGSNAICGLGDVLTACLTMAQNMPEPKYKEMLMGADIGISLMISPHPSLPPFDFAAAGIVTVTNSFETKTQKSFDRVSKNIIAAKPTLTGVVKGIKEAVTRIDDLRSRVEGAKMQWATEWEDDTCYGDTLFKKKINEWMQYRQIAPFEESY